MEHAYDIPKELEDAFIKVTFEEDGCNQQPATSREHKDPLTGSWIKQVSQPWSDVTTFTAFELRKKYPGYSVVTSTDGGINLLGFPSAAFRPIFDDEFVSQVGFQPFARRLGQQPGRLIDSIRFGSFHVSWGAHEFVLYVIEYPTAFGGDLRRMYVVHDGPEEHSRSLLVAAGAWATQLHHEVLVFNQGFWRKDPELWQEIQKADWKDVILKDRFKSGLQKDVLGFFGSEKLYKDLAIPWKRGIIMHGPPGNGKTISIKAIMKDCDKLGYEPLYVKSFKSYMGEEGSMAAVFSKARQMAPCVVVLEDLDSLINDQNRSYFLNQIDGLEGNDGLLVIGTTNHLDKLDPALSTRPSRFDRKYPFDDPDEDERTSYAQYWQQKLKNNKDVEFSDALVAQVAKTTDGFSFAYLKEAFVSALVLMAGYENDKPSFSSLLLGQIKTLREQLKKLPSHVLQASPLSQQSSVTMEGAARPGIAQRRGVWSTSSLGGVSLAQNGRVWATSEDAIGMPGGMPHVAARPRARGESRGEISPVTIPSLGRSFF